MDNLLTDIVADGYWDDYKNKKKTITEIFEEMETKAFGDKLKNESDWLKIIVPLSFKLQVLGKMLTYKDLENDNEAILLLSKELLNCTETLKVLGGAK